MLLVPIVVTFHPTSEIEEVLIDLVVRGSVVVIHAEASAVITDDEVLADLGVGGEERGLLYRGAIGYVCQKWCAVPCMTEYSL
jgi:hypothetical protein